MLHRIRLAQQGSNGGGKLGGDGEVRAMVVDNRRKKELQAHIREHVEAGAAIFSDELKSCKGLESDYQHAVINHAIEYVNGNVHTNFVQSYVDQLLSSSFPATP